MPKECVKGYGSNILFSAAFTWRDQGSVIFFGRLRSAVKRLANASSLLASSGRPVVKAQLSIDKFLQLDMEDMYRAP
jgi:hypothetical protein